MVARRGQKVETKIAQGEGRCSGWVWSVVCRARLVGRLEESMDDGDCENTRPVGITMLGLGVVSVSGFARPRVLLHHFFGLVFQISMIK